MEHAARHAPEEGSTARRTAVRAHDQQVMVPFRKFAEDLRCRIAKAEFRAHRCGSVEELALDLRERIASLAVTRVQLVPEIIRPLFLALDNAEKGHGDSRMLQEGPCAGED